jgi:uroporphyrin-3 C-methyltransferase
LWQHWIGEIWQEVHQLIRIDRLDRPDPAVLAPQHAVFLRENLKLRLLGARLALLGRDQATFKGELRLATQWLERYFDPRDRLVGQTADALRPLLASDLNIEAPALNESLAALKAVKLVDARGDTRSGR